MRAAAVVVALSAALSGGRPTPSSHPPGPAGSTRLPARAAAAGAEPAGTDAGPLGPDLSAPAAVPAGSSVKEVSADGGRHPVGHADGRFLEGVAGPLWSLANGRGVLSPLASCGRLGTDPAGLVGSWRSVLLQRGRPRIHSLRRILDYVKTMTVGDFHNFVHGTAHPCIVNRHNRLRTVSDPSFNVIRVNH